MRVTLAQPAYASVTRSSHHVQSSATARSAGGEGVLGRGLQPRVEVIERQVERGAVAEALHRDDRDALGGDHRDEGQRRRRNCMNRRIGRKGTITQEAHQGRGAGGPCLLSRLVLAFARC